MVHPYPIVHDHTGSHSKTLSLAYFITYFQAVTDYLSEVMYVSEVDFEYFFKIFRFLDSFSYYLTRYFLFYIRKHFL